MIYCIKKEFLHNYRDQLSVFFILSISVFFSLRYKTMDFRIILYIVHSLTSVCSVYIHPHNISQWLLSISSRSHNQSLAFIIFPAIPTTLHYRIIIFINLKHRPTLRDVIFSGIFVQQFDLYTKEIKICQRLELHLLCGFFLQVDFFWINRCQRSFEWFLSLLNELEVEQCCQRLTKSFVDMHIHMTSALNKNDMKGIGLQLALDLIHAKNSVDMITGLRTKTSPGRPNWDKVCINHILNTIISTHYV